MTHTLKNKNLEIRIDLPLENYNLARFDWTGKIVSVKYKNISVSGVEKLSAEDETNYVKGFYNEFGIELPVGYDEINEGDWFPKLGVGLLKKDNEPYLFSRNYEIRPAEFLVSFTTNSLIINCISENHNDYSYELTKEIILLENSFVINYRLKNTGSKTIVTNEYNHNFIAINEDLVGDTYILKFPFDIKPELFGATVNTEDKVEIGQREIRCHNTPNKQFFFSNLSGGEKIAASWEIINLKSKIGIRETGSFETSNVNLWGWKHVISPELFFAIDIKPGEELKWARTYDVFELN